MPSTYLGREGKARSRGSCSEGVLGPGRVPVPLTPRPMATPQTFPKTLVKLSINKLLRNHRTLSPLGLTKA